MSYRDPNTDISVRPLQEWFVDPGNGDAVFCRPFVESGDDLARLLEASEPLETLSPGEPPRDLRKHPGLKDGYDFIGSISETNPNFQIAVLATDAAYAEDLGMPGEVEEIIEEFDVMAFGITRSVERLARAGAVADETGRLLLPNGVEYQQGYTTRLFSAAAGARGGAFDIDPARDFDGRAAGPTERLLQGMHDIVALTGMEEGYEGGRFFAADVAYINTLQWHMVGSLGMKLGETWAERRVDVNSALVVVPAEHADIARKLTVLGVEQVGADFMNDLVRQSEVVQDTAYCLQEGRVPAHMLG